MDSAVAMTSGMRCEVLNHCDLIMNNEEVVYVDTEVADDTRVQV
jgi:hypothetical protein